MFLKKTAILGAFLVVLLALAPVDIARAEQMGDFSLIDPPLPTPKEQFEDQLGAKLGLADFKGAVVVLNFWASWCAPCVAEMPTLDALQGAMAAEGVKVVAVSIDREGIEKAAPFFRRTGVTNLTLYTDRLSKLFQEMEGTVLPTTFILDRDGQVVLKFVGPTDWNGDHVKERLREYLQRTPTQTSP